MILIALALLALNALFHRVGPGSRLEPGAGAFALAAIGFLGSSAGTTLVVLGHHIFDQVPISGRWARQPLAVQPSNEAPAPLQAIPPAAHPYPLAYREDRAPRRSA